MQPPARVAHGDLGYLSEFGGALLVDAGETRPPAPVAPRDLGCLSEFGGALLERPKRMQSPAIVALGKLEGF